MDELRAIWNGMKARCYNPKNISYKYYGARGIRVHDTWRPTLAAFAAGITAGIGPRPSRLHSLDRIDNDGHYEPGNVRWATSAEQRNTSRNAHRFLTYKGRRLTVAEWERLRGVASGTFKQRALRGWSDARILNTRIRNGVYFWHGETLPLRDWADRLGLSHLVLNDRLKRGWDIDRAFSTPVKETTVFTWRNRSHTLREWAAVLGVPFGRLHSRHKRGWSVDRMLST